MQVSLSNNQPTFSRIITGNSAHAKLRDSNCPKQVINQFVRIKRILYQQKVSHSKNIDTVLEYSPHEGFYLTVNSKRGYFPDFTIPPYFKNIINTEKRIKELKEWVNYWEYICG